MLLSTFMFDHPCLVTVVLGDHNIFVQISVQPSPVMVTVLSMDGHSIVSCVCSIILD